MLEVLHGAIRRLQPAGGIGPLLRLAEYARTVGQWQVWWLIPDGQAESDLIYQTQRHTECLLDSSNLLQQVGGSAPEVRRKSHMNCTRLATSSTLASRLLSIFAP